MRHVWVAALLWAAALPVRAQEPEVNVNERYTVESVEISGADQSKLDQPVRDNLRKLVGQKFSQEKLEELLKLIHKAFPGRPVSIQVSRGSAPEHVKVTFAVGGRSKRFDLTAPKAVYHARQGWSGEVDGSVQAHSSVFALGVLSDNDTLVERFAGFKARYENRKVGTDRLRLAFEFGSFHQMWNGATLAASADQSAQHVPTDLYRTRQNFEPLATVVLARPLKLSVGASFQRFQTQVSAARTDAANAVIVTLRYDRLLEESGPSKHRLEAGYGLRAATRTLDSDFVYARHIWDFGYTFWRGNHKLSERWQAGAISGSAPLFERFVLGNSSTLRGWNKFDLAPLGGSRMAHNSVEYRYRAFQIFYDAGAVWTRGQNPALKHSAGAGVHIGDLALLVAFPIRNGRVDPVFIAGLNL
jgi:Omp85 superfamily domain